MTQQGVDRLDSYGSSIDHKLDYMIGNREHGQLVHLDSGGNLEALLAQLLTPVRYAAGVRVSCAAAGDYAALDVMSASATDTAGTATYVPNLARTAGGVVTFQTIRVKCSEDAVLTSLRLHFFNAAPLAAEVEMDDNAAFSIATAAGLAKHQGSVLLNAFVDIGVAESSSNTSGLQESFKCATGQTGLWMVVTTEVAETNETANMTLDFDFFTY